MSIKTSFSDSSDQNLFLHESCSAILSIHIILKFELDLTV